MQSKQAGGENGSQFIKPLIRGHFGGALVVAQDGPSVSLGSGIFRTANGNQVRSDHRWHASHRERSFDRPFQGTAGGRRFIREFGAAAEVSRQRERPDDRVRCAQRRLRRAATSDGFSRTLLPDVSIRSLGFECVVRDEGGNEVAKPDVLRAMRRFHKYARFQIQERAYEVTRLSINWNERAAEAIARKVDRLDYTTTSVVKTECTVESTLETCALGDNTLERGNVRFRVFVDSYYRIPTSGSGSPEYQPLGVAAPPHA